MSCAGRSGDATYLPILESKYRDVKEVRRSGEVDTFRLTLARLGSPLAMKEMLCEARFGQASIHWDAAQRREKLGGKLAVKTFSEWLEERPDVGDLGLQFLPLRRGGRAVCACEA